MDKKFIKPLEAQQFDEIAKKYYPTNSTVQRNNLSNYKSDGDNRKMEPNNWGTQTRITTQTSTLDRKYQFTSTSVDHNGKRNSITSYGSSSSMKTHFEQQLPVQLSTTQFNKPETHVRQLSNIGIRNGTPSAAARLTFLNSPSLPSNNISTNAIMYQPPNPNKIMPISAKPNLILHQNLSPKKSLNEKLKPAHYYIMNFRNYEKKLIQKLKVANLKDRKSSIKDVDELKKTFKKFEMKGEIFDNLKLKQIEKEMEKIANKDFSMNSAFVMVIMTHGKENFELCAKDDLFKLHSHIISKIIENEHLANKPKIIFIEACRGPKDPLQLYTDDWERNSAGPPGDVIIFHATFEEYVSYSHKNNGSFFIQNLCEHLQAKGKTESIHKICDDVIEDVRSKTKQKQIPEKRSTYTQRYCFGDYCKN